MVASLDEPFHGQAYFTRGRLAAPVDVSIRAMQQKHPYLSVEDVARRFGVNTTTIYRLVKRGKLPGFKVGSQWRFSEYRLDEWVANHERIG